MTEKGNVRTGVMRSLNKGVNLFVAGLDHTHNERTGYIKEVRRKNKGLNPFFADTLKGIRRGFSDAFSYCFT